MAHLAWQSQPPEENPETNEEAPPEGAEVVDLTKQRFLGWVKGMFGGRKTLPGDED